MKSEFKNHFDFKDYKPAAHKKAAPSKNLPKKIEEFREKLRALPRLSFADPK